jgi:lysozyme
MTILGIDISKWNGNWDAVKAKQAGATFVFIKASQATFADPQFLVNWQKAKDAGLLRAAYHYLDYTKPGIDQANFFADQLKNDPGELPPIIDYELRRTDNNPSAALGFLRDCLDQMIKRTELYEDASVKRPMIYSGPGFWVEYGDQTKSDYWIQFPLWNAHWTTSSTPLIPLPWTMWHFWQFTSKGPGEAFGGEGLSMDMDRFNGTLNELMEFAGIRIPIVNLSEKFETLDEKVNTLQGLVSTINSTGNANSGIISRVDNLEGQISNLGGSVNTLTTTLTQRIAAVERSVATLGNIPSTSTTPTNTTSNSTTPTNITSDSTAPINTSSSNDLYATCITSALNVRSGPSASYPMVAGLRYGQRVKVINRQNGWAQFENPVGWSSEAYLSFEQSVPSAPAESPQPATATTPASYGICNTSGLNVRSGPGVTNPIVGGLTYGQRIKIVTNKNGWVQIEAPSGWCNASYLSFA